MKLINFIGKLSVLLLFAALLMLFSSCSDFPADEQPAATTDLPAVYSSLISLLESELDGLRASEKRNTAEYEARIAELEKKLAEALETSGTTTTADTAKPAEPSPFTYTAKEGKATITAYTGSYSVLVIPGELDGNKVTAIADGVFSANTVLTGVSLPDGLEKVGWFAFSGCTSLKSVTLPSSVTEIGYDAFAYCTKLTIHCDAGSYAEKFAKSYGIACIAD